MSRTSIREGISILIAAVLAVSFLAGCGSGSSSQATSGETIPASSEGTELTISEEAAPAASEETASAAVGDGRARPSVCGSLQVRDGKLCSDTGEPVMLRGVSTHELTGTESFLNEETFRELSVQDGVNLIRLATYTYGVGIVGYCTGGDKDRYKEDIGKRRRAGQTK